MGHGHSITVRWSPPRVIFGELQRYWIHCNINNKNEVYRIDKKINQFYYVSNTKIGTKGSFEIWAQNRKYNGTKTRHSLNRVRPGTREAFISG